MPSKKFSFPIKTRVPVIGGARNWDQEKKNGSNIARGDTGQQRAVLSAADFALGYRRPGISPRQGMNPLESPLATSPYLVRHLRKETSQFLT